MSCGVLYGGCGESVTRLKIRLLGPFRVALDGEPATGFESDKVRALLAYLAVTGDRSHRRETLAGLLWPEYPERSARASLRNALANLRTVIRDRARSQDRTRSQDRASSGDHDSSPPFLHITPQTIQFNSDSDHWLDVAAFTNLLTGDEPTSEALEAAVSLYRGPFLEGFSIPDSAAFEEWLLFKREQLSRQVLDALHELAGVYELRGAYEQALSHAWRQVELEPWREEGYRQLMRLLTLSGRRSEALAQYEKCRQLLRDELGVEPGAETAALYEAIRSGQLTRHGEAILRRQPRPLLSLPSQSTHFLGREDALAALEGLLADSDVHMVTILGPGGIGKTRLAVEVGTRLAERCNLLPDRPQSDRWSRTSLARDRDFPNGIIFVPLAPVSSAGELVATLTQALQLRLEGGKDQLLDYLQQKSLLLILDNLEHLVDGASLLAEILRVAPGVKVLITARERMQIQGEHLFPIGGLAFPERDPVPSMFSGTDGDARAKAYVESYAAIRMFFQSASRVQPQFAVASKDVVAMAQICRVVEGMPLAIELAASWADVLSPSDILTEMRQNLDFLQSEWRDIPRRQRSIRVVFDASWERLAPTEQRVFAQLCVFRAGFTRTAAEQVAMETPEATGFLRLLSKLIGKSFIQYDRVHDRYQIHELLRQFGSEKLAADAAQEAAIRDRHCAYHAAALERWGEALKGPQQTRALAEIEAESENARAAWHWAVERGQVERMGQALEGLCLFYVRRGRFQEGESACRQAIERLNTTVSERGLRLLARTLGWQSVFSHSLGRVELAEGALQQGQEILEQPRLSGLDTRQEKAFLWRQMARMIHFSSAKEARQLLEQSLALYAEVGDRWSMANVLDELGSAAELVGAYSEAQSLCQESLGLRRALEDQEGIAYSLLRLGTISRFQGEVEDAERFIRESLVISRELGDRDMVAQGLYRLGLVLVQRGMFAEAHPLLDESVAICEDLAHHRALAWMNLTLGEAEAHLGWYPAARSHGQRGSTLSQKTANRWALGYSDYLLGLVALAGQAYPEALESLLAGARAFREIEVQENLGRALAVSIYAARGLGQHSQAQRCLVEALEIAIKIGAFFPLAYALPAAALLQSDMGEPERAVELYALATNHPFVANSHWFKDVAGRELATVAAGLPPETASEARFRGRAADRWQAAAALLETLRAGLV
jgi:DNA-binding SARP family transcriptional activator/predicted ATPase